MYAGIPVSVSFQPADDRLAAEVWADLERIDEVFNDHRDDSEIGRINAGGAGTFTLSEPLALAFACAENLQQLTAGAFSITTGPLRRLWRQAAQTGQIPDPESIATCRRALEPDAWHRDGKTVSVFDPGVRFDFGGLIKGMAVDQVMKKLLDAGTTAALVQCGGETACYGSTPCAWHPRPAATRPAAVVHAAGFGNWPFRLHQRQLPQPSRHCRHSLPPHL
jgi:thiamine biosynthesis lipoprotein